MARIEPYCHLLSHIAMTVINHGVTTITIINSNTQYDSYSLFLTLTTSAKALYYLHVTAHSIRPNHDHRTELLLLVYANPD